MMNSGKIHTERYLNREQMNLQTSPKPGRGEPSTDLEPDAQNPMISQKITTSHDFHHYLSTQAL
jgi:hypothetical protein